MMDKQVSVIIPAYNRAALLTDERCRNARGAICRALLEYGGRGPGR